MLAILKKDFTAFFTNPTGYMVIGLFLLTNSLMLWYLKGSSNILQSGFADLQTFFDVTPWFFILLIPAISMRSFSEEYTSGTIEILQSNPLTSWDILLGKFLASLSLILLSLLPTLLYAFSIAKLAQPETIDWAQIIGSYFGLILIATAFTAISIFASLLSKNQIVALFIGIVLSLFFYYTFTQIQLWNSGLPLSFSKIGMYEHYRNMSRGVIDTQDIVYFFSISFFFLYLSKLKLDD